MRPYRLIFYFFKCYLDRVKYHETKNFSSQYENSDDSLSNDGSSEFYYVGIVGRKLALQLRLNYSKADF